MYLLGDTGVKPYMYCTAPLTVQISMGSEHVYS